MTVYVYGIVRAGGSSPRRSGVTGARVQTIESGPLAAITSAVPAETMRTKRRDLLKHSEVLQDAFATGVVLPFRFGTVFPGENALVDELLGARREELVRLLDRFDGLGELRLRASYHDQAGILAEIVRDDPAIGMLREESRERGDEGALFRLGEAVAAAYAERRRSDAEAIIGRLGEHSVELLVDEPQAELEIVRSSFLVQMPSVTSFDAALESLALRLRHLIAFTCTGPVPPHSFVSLSER